MKRYFIYILLVNFLFSSLVFAQVSSSSDLGIENPGLLPTNPFYFFKEWGRGVERLFTFNPISKAELELRISNEKAAEAQKVQELKPEDSTGIARAFKNYQNSQESLKIKLGELATTSKNTNLERLLENLTEQSLKHAQIFNELDKKLSDTPELKNAISGIKNSIESTVAAAAQKEDPNKFASRLEKAISDSGPGELKNARSLEIVTQIQKQLPEETKNSLEKLRENFSVKSEEDLKQVMIKPLQAVRMPVLMQPVSRCESLNKGILELEELLKLGKIDEASYETKYSYIKKALLDCEQPADLQQKPMPMVPALEKPREVATFCTQQYEPVCGEDGKTYSNACFAKVSEISIKYRGECGNEYKEPVSAMPLPAVSAVPIEKAALAEPFLQEFKIEADDFGFYPNSVITAPKGSKVRLYFIVRNEKVYYGGLDFRSSHFKAGPVKPGGIASVEFIADESFEFSSYWPLTGVLKTTGKVMVQ